MKTVILAGGLGTRLSEETELKPKPMVEIGGRPILWHIMKQLGSFGHSEFYIALGYKGELIKRYFLEYQSLSGNMSLDLAHGNVASSYERACEPWKVHLFDTGLETMTGGRVKRLRKHLTEGTFMVTYGDGVADVDVRALLDFHRRHGRLATVTAVRPPARYGGLVFDGDLVSEFTEKPQIGEGWINGGFMLLEPGVFEYLDGDSSILETDGLERLAADGQLAGYRHDRFWQCMDTLREKRILEHLWQQGHAPWKNWT